jgi:HK97 family phage prohead protease
MRHKTISSARVEVKSADKGEVRAVFSTLNTVDHDGDVTLPGAFTNGEKVRISAYNHQSWQGALPVGRGQIFERDSQVELEGKFFLDTQQGRETFAVVKEMDDLQEWSYGYDVIDSEPGTQDGRSVQYLKKLKVHEVSPVLLGAGIGTHTVAVKGHASDADRAAIYRRAMLSMARASIVQAGIVLADHQNPDPRVERSVKADAMVERLWRAEVRGRVV